MVIYETDGRLFHASGTVIETARFVDENRGRVEQNGLLALHAGVGEGSQVGSLVDCGEFIVRGRVEVGASEAGSRCSRSRTRAATAPAITSSAIR